MAKVLVLAESGFGKTFSIAQIKELGQVGLDPKTTYLITSTPRMLSFPGGNVYKPTTPAKYAEGNRCITNNSSDIIKVLKALLYSNNPYTDIVLDDFNYIMQDYYMENAKADVWNTCREVGYDMGQLFKLMMDYRGPKNIFVLAHPNIIDRKDGRAYYRLKTVGNMVDSYITPEGKFDLVIVGISSYDSMKGKTIREYIVKENDKCASAKSPYGMFDENTIPNDLGVVKAKINEYMKGIFPTV